MAEIQTATAAAGTTLAGKYLTFTLQDESYGIEVLKVREIIRLSNITAVPQMPDYVRGVINLRGRIIPVMDLRRRFGFAEAAATDLTCIVVVQVKTPEGKLTPMGLIVDGVEEVVNIGAGDIEPTPEFGGQIATDYLVGMAKIKNEVKALLDIDKIVSGTELSRLAGVSSAQN
ncbi:MAG TPA: chemotaxis protein CheW [Dongiaceae bacterium]|jgi:purine-binding chemotaxis protein CheW|nr:chemotaxis protein CheW [Dongiaceae bacterium]